MASVEMLVLEPRELVFTEVKFHQAQHQTIKISNDLKAPVEGEIRPGSNDRYTVTPSSFRLRPGESVDVTVTLKLDSKFAQRQKATENGQRDSFFIKTKFFDQRFTSIFYLHPEPEQRHSTLSSSRSSRASSLSPRRSSDDPTSVSSQLQQAASSPFKTLAAPALNRSSSMKHDTGNTQQPNNTDIAGQSAPSTATSPEQQQADQSFSADTASRQVAMSVLMQSAGESQVQPRRRPQKSVSFADLPTWETPAAPKVSVDDTAGTVREHRRASDTEVTMQHSSYLTRSRSSEQLSHSGSHKQPAHAAAGGLQASFDAGLKSWRESLRVAQQQQEQQQPEVSTARPASKDLAVQQTGHLARLSSSPSEISSQTSAAQVAATDSDLAHSSWVPNLSPVREESPVNRPTAAPAPLMQAASADVDGSQRAHNLAGSAADSELVQEVAELRAALSAAEEELAASQELMEHLVAEHPDAAKLFEAGAKQEQAVQEERNKRALELLLQKDSTIRQLQERCRLAEEQLSEQQCSLAAAEGKARAAVALQQQLEDKLKLLQQQHKQELDDLRQAHSVQIQAMEERLAAQAKQLLQAQQEVLQLSGQSSRLPDHQAGHYSAHPPRSNTPAEELSLDQGVAHGSPDASLTKTTPMSSLRPSGTLAAATDDAGHLLALLAERDAELATLEAELAVARAALAGNTESEDPPAAAQIVLLQRDLAEAHAALQAQQERLTELEALQALAEAAAEEGELLAAREQCSAGAARREATRQQTEAEVARLTAARLNARVSELAAELAEASARADKLQRQLDAQQQLHARESKAMQKKLAALIAAGGSQLADLEQEYDAITLPVQRASDQQLKLQLDHSRQASNAALQKSTSVAATAGSSAATFAKSDPDSSREAVLAQALEDAEATVALLQSRLLEATQQQQLTAAKLEELQERAAQAAVRHSQQLASAKQAGSVQLAALQEALTRLGNRSELAGQAAALSLEVSELKRSETKLLAEVKLLQQQFADVQQQLEDSRLDLQHHKQQQQSVAIHTTYPLMRAAKLLEAVQRMKLRAADITIRPTRPWPCLDAAASNLSTKPDAQLTLKLAADMTANEQVAAAAAASAWLGEMARGQELIASLLQRAQNAEKSLAAASLAQTDKQRQLTMDQSSDTSKALVPVSKQQVGQTSIRNHEGGSTTAVSGVDSDVQSRLLHLQQELLLTQAELKSARQQRELADVEMSRLSAQLEACAVAATAAVGSVEDVEKAVQQKLQAAVAQHVQTCHRLNVELTTAHHRTTEAEAAAAEAVAEKDAAVAAVASLKQQVARQKTELSSATAEVTSVKSAAAAQAQDMRQQIAAKDREIHRLSGEVDSHVMQAAVLLETIETLQSGASNEQEQRLVALTAQLASAQKQAAAQEARIRGLLDECEHRAFSASQLKQALEAAQQEVASQVAAVSAADGAAAKLESQLEELKVQVKTSGQQVTHASRELSVLKQQLAAADAEVEGLRTALAEAQARHEEQLQRERQTAAAASKQALSGQLLKNPPQAYVAHVSHMTVVLDSLLKAAQTAVNKHTGVSAIASLSASSRAGKGSRSSSARLGLASGSITPDNDVTWVVGVMMRMKDLLLESDRFYVKCQIESQLSAHQVSTATAQLAATQASVERLTSQWQTAEAAKEALIRAGNTRADHACVQVVERLHMQETRIEALFTENQQLLEQLAAAQSSATEAKTAGSIARRTASSLALQLEAATTELDSLRRVTAAATAEAAGYADWATALRPGGQEGVGAEYVSEGVKQRDAGLFKWFESRIMTLLGSGGSVEGVQQSQLMALTRQVCGLKLVESQLLASLAAAAARTDAATLRSQRLAAALDAATAKLATAASKAAESDDSSCAENECLEAEITHCKTQILARDQEVYRLQDHLLQAKQLLSSRELEIGELQARLAEVNQASTEQQAADAAALAAQRAALTAAAAAEEARLRREVQDLCQLLDKQSAESSAAISSERLEAAKRAEDSAAAAAVAAQEAAASALHAAEVRVALLEGQLDVLEQERDMLQEQVFNLQTQVTDLQASGEVTNAAVQGLEATLAAIERAESRRASQGPAAAAATRQRSVTPPRRAAGHARHSVAANAAGQPAVSKTHAGSRRGSREERAAEQQVAASRSGSSSDGDEAGRQLQDAAGDAGGGDSVSLLSRELVKAQMSAADLQRKLRVSARAEIELRQRLAERDARLVQVKQQLGDSKREAETLQRRVSELLGSKGSGMSSTAGSGLSRKTPLALRTDGSLIRDNSGARPPSMRSSRTWLNVSDEAPTEADAIDGQQQEQEQPLMEGDQQVAFAAAHGLAAAEKEYLAHQIAALRIALAKKDAEVERLQGALAEAIAQQTAATPVPAQEAARLPSSKQTSRHSSLLQRVTPTHSAGQQQLLDGAVDVLSVTPEAEVGSPRAPKSLQQQRLSNMVDRAGRPSAVCSTYHSATAAARLARQASARSAAAQAEPMGFAATSDDRHQQQHNLALQLAAAKAELASAVATARQVLSDLMLGSEAQQDQVAEVQAELSLLSLEEVMTEVVYQVHDKLTHAARAAEAAIASAGEHGPTGDIPPTRSSNKASQVPTAVDAETAVAGMTAERDALSAQVQALIPQLEAAAAEREALAAKLDTAAAAREELAKHLASALSERDSLAHQNAALASALSGRFSEDARLMTPSVQSESGAAAADALATTTAAHSGVSSGVNSASGGTSSSGAGGAAGPSPAQMRKIGQLMEKLTKDNAALIKARDAAVSKHSGLLEELAATQDNLQQLQQSLQIAHQQVCELLTSKEQLETAVAMLQRELEEAGATQENLQAQVTGARAERDMLAKENVTLAATTNQLMASATAADDAPTVVQNRQPSQSVFVPASASFGSQRNRTTSAPPTPGADPRLTAAAADSGTAAAGIGSGKGNAAKVTSSQLREIGQMLARLTRENAALIKQRDKLEAAVAPAQAEARKYAAAAATADKEKQVLLEAKNNARQEADAAVLEAQKAVAALKQLSAERDRLQQQVTSLTAERDSMAAQNMALASATSQLMSTAAGDPGRGTSTAGSVVTTTAHGTADITARVAALTAAMEAATSSNTTSPVTSETGGSAATAAKAAVACTADAGRSLHKKAGSTAGGVLNAAQAKEVGALLTRLAAENAAFLKAKDEAVTARDSAMNKVTALEVEMDMLRQQMRDLEQELQHARNQRQQQQHGDWSLPSPAHSSASVSAQSSTPTIARSSSVRPSMRVVLPAEAQQAVGVQSASIPPDTSRVMQLCKSIQRSVSCAESIHQALSAASTAASTPRPSVLTAATSTAAGSAGAVSPAADAQGLTQVLGVELSVLKEAAAALDSQLQQLTAQQRHSAVTAFGSDAVGSQQGLRNGDEFSFGTAQVAGLTGTADLSGFQQELQQQQQQIALEGLQNQQQQPLEQLQAGSGIVSISVAVLSQLQAAAQHHQKRSSKWKVKCKQLTQHIAALTAQMQQMHPVAAGTTQCSPVAEDSQQQQDASRLDQMGAAVAAGQQEVQQLKQQLMACTQMSKLDAHQATALLQRLEATESSLMQQLSSSVSSAGALLNKGQQLADSAAAAAGTVEDQVTNLLTAAAGVEARVMALERTMTRVQQDQVEREQEHQQAVAGATQIQGQLASLQHQLADTTARFAAEQQQLEAALTAAVEAQREAEAEAAKAQEQLEAAREAFADRLGEAERQHKANLAELQSRHRGEVADLKRALIEAKNMSEAAATAAVAGRLAAAESGRAAAEAALCQMAAEVRSYQAAKAGELQQLEAQIEALLLTAPAAVAAELADSAETPAAAIGLSRRSLHATTAGASRGRFMHGTGMAKRRIIGTAVGGVGLQQHISHHARPASIRGEGRQAGRAAAAAGHGTKHRTARQPNRSNSTGSAGLDGLLVKLRQDILHPGSRQQHPAVPADDSDAGYDQRPDIQAVAAEAMAAVREADALVSAEREANFHRIARQRAEAAVDALHAALARLKARLKASKAEADDLRQAAAAGAIAAVECASAREEAARAYADLAAAKESLKAAKTESQRRQRQQAAAVAAAAAAASNAGSSNGIDLIALLNAGGVDGDAAGLGDNSRMTAVITVLQRELAAVGSAKEGVEQKMKESKTTIDRKNVLIRELKARVEELSSRLASNPTAVLEERAAAAEGRAKQLAASLARKEVSLKEAKQALEDTKSKLDELVKSGGGGNGGELERQAKMIQRLRAEVTRKEQALQAVTCDLEKCKEQLTAATAAADAANKKQAAAEAGTRRAVLQQQQRVAAAGHALKAVASLLLACLATMTAAAAALQQHAQAAAAAAAAEAAQQTADHSSNSTEQTPASAAAAALVASGLADMVCLSQDELKDLLGAEDETCRLLMLTNGDAAGAESGASSTAVTLHQAASRGSLPSSSSSQQLTLFDSGMGCSQRHQQLLQDVDEAVAQLVKADVGAAVGSRLTSSMSSITPQQQQQEQQVSRPLPLLESVVQSLSDEAAAGQQQLRVAVTCVC